MRCLTAAFGALLLSLSLSNSVSVADDCVCTVSGPVSVDNFPSVQIVSLDKLPLEVRETDTSKTYSATLEMGTGERRPLGPFPLTGRHRASFQVTQIDPKPRLAAPLLGRWYVRFDSNDVFFDPCREVGSGICSTGFPVLGAKLTPLLSQNQAEKLEGFFIANAPVSIATIGVVGTEGLLVVDNAGSGPRTLRVQIVLDR